MVKKLVNQIENEESSKKHKSKNGKMEKQTKNVSGKTEQYSNRDTTC